MTWPLVNPSAGYRTLSRLVSLSWCPSISTRLPVLEATEASLPRLRLLRFLGRGEAGLEGGEQLEHLLPVGVGELVRFEVVDGEAVHQLAGHLQLPLGDLHVRRVRQVEVIG